LREGGQLERAAAAIGDRSRSRVCSAARRHGPRRQPATRADRCGRAIPRPSRTWAVRRLGTTALSWSV